MKAAGIEKPRRTYVTDTVEVAALIALGRYKNGVPLWWKVGDDTLLVEADVLKEWREAKATALQRHCEGK